MDSNPQPIEYEDNKLIMELNLVQCCCVCCRYRFKFLISTIPSTSRRVVLNIAQIYVMYIIRHDSSLLSKMKF